MGRRNELESGPLPSRSRADPRRIPAADQFPYILPAIRHLETLAFHPKVTFFIGENGSGKSTLIEAIAVSCGLNPEGGSRNFNFATRASHSNLGEALQIAKAPRTPADSYFLRGELFHPGNGDRAPGSERVRRPFSARAIAWRVVFRPVQ